MKPFSVLSVNGELVIEGASVGSTTTPPYLRDRDVDLKASFKPVPSPTGILILPYIPATSWVGVMRNLLEKYYDLPANVPRVVRAKKIVAPIHECEGEDDKARCPVCKLLARRDVVAWFDDAEPLGSLLRIREGADEVSIFNERGALVAKVYLKDEVIIPRENVQVNAQKYGGELGISEPKNLLTAEDIKGAGWRLETIPRKAQLVSGTFKFSAKFLLSKLSVDDIRPFFVGLSLLQDYYIGRRGSRGYGRLEISNLSFSVRGRSYYDGSGDEIRVDLPEDARTPKGVLRKWEEVKRAIEEALKKAIGQ
ncbi:MAG: RAMP superfamily CRISPR-associated protein [Candidatus Bathyarchaeia archaeon]